MKDYIATSRKDITVEKKQILLKKAQVAARTSLSGTSIYDMSKAGKFPKSVKLGSKRVCWVEAEVDQWIADQIAAARGVAA